MIPMPNVRIFGLRICPTDGRDLSWKLLCFTDFDYKGDQKSQRSVSGYIIFIRRVLVALRSKAQRSVTLSSFEAE